MSNFKKIILILNLFILFLSISSIVNATMIDDKQSEFAPGEVLIMMRNNNILSRFAINNDIFLGLVFTGIDVGSVEVLMEIDDNEILSEMNQLQTFIDNNENTRFRATDPVRILLLNLLEDDYQSVKDAIEILRHHPDVIYAEPNYMIFPEVEYGFISDSNYMAFSEERDRFIPDDARFNELWGMMRIGAPEAWAISRGSRDVLVGVMDSGIDIHHPDLAANVDTSLGRNLLGGNDIPANGHDYSGHGTHVAGTIGAVGNNGIGVAGVVHHVTLVDLRVSTGAGGGSVQFVAIIRAIEHANAIGLDILNASWGGPGQSVLLETAIRNFRGLVVAAAGNHGGDTHFPAAHEIPNLISVGNLNLNNMMHPSSGRHERTTDIFAPGGQILSTASSTSTNSGHPSGIGQYIVATGTSMATPHVAGAAALALSVNPNLTASELREAILNTVDPVPALIGYAVTGGVLNVRRLVDYVIMD